MIRAQVIVRPRASIFDPQGDAVRHAIHHLGLKEVVRVQIGKVIELEIDAPNVSIARARLETICRDLLSNPVIEDYELNFPVAAPAKPLKNTPVKAKSAVPVRTSAAKKAVKSLKKDGARKKKKR